MAEYNIYPKEVAVIKRRTITAEFDAEFVPAKDGEPPLMIYGGGGLSRIVVKMIEKGNTSIYANIPVTELAGLFAATDYAAWKCFENASCPGADGGASPAYTVTFRGGRLKGMTPAQVIAKMGEAGIEELKNQYSFLKQNADKYPANREQMAAITDAANLYREGKLDTSVQHAAGDILIYHADSRALRSKRREDGMCLTYGIDIKCMPGQKSPVTISVDMFFAPLTEREDGTISPAVSQMDTSTKKHMSLNVTLSEWLNAVRAVKAAMNQFETAYARSCIAEAERIAKERRLQAG